MPETKRNDPMYEKWIAGMSLMMSWLLHSMQPNIRRGYMILGTAHEIWMAVSQSCSQVWNDAQVYEMVKRAHENRQGERSLAEYYAEIRAGRQEINYYENKADVLLML